MSRNHILLTAILPFLLTLSSCREKYPEAPARVPAIILDTDIGSSYDDLVALAMLHVFQDRGLCRLAGVVVDRMGEDCASVADIMDSWYGRPDLPLGLVRDGIPDPVVWIDYRNMADYADTDGNLIFHGSGRSMSELPDGYRLYRRLLSEAPDCSVSICSIGFMTALSQLLESGPDEFSDMSGVELVRKKVKCLYMMGGVFDGSLEPDYNFSQGLSFASTFFRLWPSDVDVVMSPSEVGNGIDYTPDQVLEDLPEGHPVCEMLRRCTPDEGQRMWDPMTVIDAVEGDGLFRLSARGEVTMGEDGSTTFSETADGNFRYQLPGDDDWNSEMLRRIRRTMRNGS
ncbi:MAG: hypothetical protein ACI39U_06950 [Candidatus Cryptobacteroides sp.]